MATSLDKTLVPVVLAIINKVGRDMDFTFPRASSYNPVDGVGSEAIRKTLTVKASPPIDFEQRYIDGDSVRRGDVRIFLAASGLAFTPERDMLVKFDNEEFKTVAVLPLHSGEQIAAFELQMRR